MKVLLFSIEPSTYSIAISTTFIYSLSLWTRIGIFLIFNHIWIIGFTFVVFCIIYLSIMIHSEFEKNACTSSNTILCLLCNVQNVVLMREKWERKYLTSLSNQYYEYTIYYGLLIYYMHWNSCIIKVFMVMERIILADHL